MDSVLDDTMNGSTMTASTMPAASTQLPDGWPASMNAFETTSRPTKPYTTEGMPASRSMALHSAARSAGPAAHDKNSAHPMATSSANASASTETATEPAMKFAMPKLAPVPKSTGIQLLPSKNAERPTSETMGQPWHRHGDKHRRKRGRRPQARASQPNYSAQGPRSACGRGPFFVIGMAVRAKTYFAVNDGM